MRKALNKPATWQRQRKQCVQLDEEKDKSKEKLNYNLLTKKERDKLKKKKKELKSAAEEKSKGKVILRKCEITWIMPSKWCNYLHEGISEGENDGTKQEEISRGAKYTKDFSLFFFFSWHTQINSNWQWNTAEEERKKEKKKYEEIVAITCKKEKKERKEAKQTRQLCNQNERKINGYELSQRPRRKIMPQIYSCMQIKEK